jgi:hypothetical protein
VIVKKAPKARRQVIRQPLKRKVILDESIELNPTDILTQMKNTGDIIKKPKTLDWNPGMMHRQRFNNAALLSMVHDNVPKGVEFMMNLNFSRKTAAKWLPHVEEANYPEPNFDDYDMGPPPMANDSPMLSNYDVDSPQLGFLPDYNDPTPHDDHRAPTPLEDVTFSFSADQVQDSSTPKAKRSAVFPTPIKHDNAFAVQSSETNKLGLGSSTLIAISLFQSKLQNPGDTIKLSELTEMVFFKKTDE